MITVTFSCTTATELHRELITYLNQIAPDSKRPADEAQMEFPNVASINCNPIAVTEIAIKDPKTRAKAKKEPKNNLSEGTVVKEHSPIEEETKVAAPKAPITNSREAVHIAVQQVNVSCGLPVAREIITSFGAQRLSEIKETDYAAFINKCHDALAQA